MPSRRYVVFPQGGGKPAPGAYNAATDVTRLRRQSRTFGDSIVQTQRDSWQTSSTVTQSYVPPGGTLTLKQYLYSLMGGKGYLTALTLNHFGGSTGGRLMSQMLVVNGPTATASGGDASFTQSPTNPTYVVPSALNCSIQNVTTGGVKSNSNQCPAIFGINFNTAGTQGSNIPLSEELARIAEHQSQNGIVHLTWMTPSPTGGGSNGIFSGAGNEYPGVITPGNAVYNTFMYGAGRTSSNPNGGVWAMAQGLISILSVAGAKSLMMRDFHECNLGASSNWWGIGNAGSAANCIVLQQQIINYVRLLLGATMSNQVLWVYNVNTGGNIAALDPGPAYRDVVSIDIYQGTTQAQVISDLSGQGITSLEALRDSNGNAVPILLSECGASTFNNSAIALQTFDESIFNGQLQASFPNLVGAINWCQNWSYGVQFNWSNVAAHGILRSAVPVYS